MRATANDQSGHHRATDELVAELDRIRAETTSQFRAEIHSVAVVSSAALAPLLKQGRELRGWRKELYQTHVFVQAICMHEMENGVCRICLLQSDDDN